MEIAGGEWNKYTIAMKCHYVLRLVLTLGLFLSAATHALAEANYVYHERSSVNPGCGGAYVPTLNPVAGQAYPFRFKVEYQNFVNQARVYYTTNGSNPGGTFGVGNVGTFVLTATFSCTFGSPVVDSWAATIPGMPAGTTVKYIVSAWHSGGGAEVFANGPGAPCSGCGAQTTNSSLATIYQYAVPTGPVVNTFKEGSLDTITGTTYTGAADTFLASTFGSHQSDNFGARGTLEIGGSSGAPRNGLIRFNVTSLAARFSAINSVTLRLHVSGVEAGGNTLQVYRVSSANSGWVEGTDCCADNTVDTSGSTWNHRVPNSTAWAGSAGASTAGTDYGPTLIGSAVFSGTMAAGTVVDIALTDSTLISDWAAGNNSGLYLKTATDPGPRIVVVSSDASGSSFPTGSFGTRPELIVGYTPANWMNALGTAYTQNFNTLSSVAGTAAWTDDSTLPGWYSQYQTGNPVTYSVGSGTDTAGALYSFGSAASSERAFGSLASGGPGTIFNALRLLNNSGSIINGFSISFTGEQWRDGNNTTPHSLAFEYRVANAGTVTDANTPSTGWSVLTALDFVGPKATTTAGALDGNLAANRTAKSATLVAAVAAGQELWLRWLDPNDAGNDHGLAIDDLIVTPNCVAPTITCPSINDRNTDPGQCTASVTFTTTVTGSPAPTVVCLTTGGPLPNGTSVTSPFSFPVGTSTVQCTANNACGSASCSFTVTVNDAAPTIRVAAYSGASMQPTPGQCGPNITVAAGPGTCFQHVGFTAIADDNCPGVGIFCTGGNFFNGGCTPNGNSVNCWQINTFSLGTTVVTCYAQDSSGLRSADCAFTVTVIDTNAPTLTQCPASFSVPATSPSGAVATYANPTASDCAPSSPVVTCNPPSGSTFPIGPNTVTCSATDAAMNSSSCQFTITVTATPVITSFTPSSGSAGTPVTIFGHNFTGATSVRFNGMGTAFTLDTSTSPHRISTTVPGPCCPSTGPITVETPNGLATSDTAFTVTPSEFSLQHPAGTELFNGSLVDFGHVPVGSSATKVFTITNMGSGVLTFNEGFIGGAHDAYFSKTALAVLSLAPGESTTFSVSFNPTFDAPRSATLGFSANDPSESSTLIDIVGTGGNAPTITCPSPITQGTDPGVCTASVSFSTPTTGTAPVDVLCKVSGGALPVNLQVSSGHNFPKGSTTVTCTATNLYGTNSCSFTVTVNDTTGPVLTLPSPITAEATGPSGAAVTFSASASDVCDGARTVTCVPASGSTFALGLTTVDCSASDVSGNTSMGSFTVTVQDTTPPVLSLPANMIVEATGTTGAATVTFSATAMDLVSGSVAVTCVPASGSSFSLGSTTVNCSASDTAGNSGSGSFSVTVQDTTPPAAPTITAGNVNLAAAPAWPLSISGEAGATISFSITDGSASVTGGGLMPGGGTFSTTVNVTSLADGTLTVSVTLTDPSGNTSAPGTASKLKDATPPAAPEVVLANVTASLTTVPLNITGEADASISYSITDGSSAVTGSGLMPSGGTFSTTVDLSGLADGTLTASATLTDALGNTSAAGTDTAQKDTVPPSITCPPNVTVQCDGDVPAANFSGGSVSDVGDPNATVTHVGDSASGSCPKTIVRTYRATDASGNTNDCAQTITVHDTTPPVLTQCPANIQAQASGPNGAIVSYANPTASDNCPPTSPTVTCNPPSGSTFPVGMTTVTCTASDACGQSASCNFVVTVEQPVNSLQAQINAANPGDTIVVAPGTYAGIVINKSITLDCRGGGVIIIGASPALTVTMGMVNLLGGTYTTSTDDPTILVTGGSLTLREAFVEESTGFNQVGIVVTGTGTLDLGTGGDPGLNTNKLSMAGLALSNDTATAISALGNEWRQDGMVLVSNSAIEDEIYHALDNSAKGLVRFVAANLYVTANSGSIQRGIDAATAGETVFVDVGTYTENVSVNKALTLSGANVGQPGCMARGPESTIAGGAGTALTVASDDVTVDGLEMTGATGISALGRIGVAVRNNKITAIALAINAGALVTTATKNLTLEDNCIALTGQMAGSTPTIGVYLSAVSGLQAPAVSGNDVSGAFYGYVLYDLQAAAPTVVSGGTIAGVKQGVAAFNINPVTLAAFRASSFGVSGVTMSGFTGSHPSSPGNNFHAGVYVFSGGPDTTATLTGTLSGLTVDGTGKISGDSAGVNLADFSTGVGVRQNITVQECTIQNNLNRGVHVRGSNAVAAVTRSTLTSNGGDPFGAGGNHGFGLVARNNSTVSVTESYIINPAAQVGFTVRAIAADASTNPEGPTLTVFNCSIDNNGNASGFLAQQSAGTLNASGNWWGGNDAAAIAAGVIGIVDFTPFLRFGTDTSGTPGFQGTFGDVHVTALGAQTGATGRIQEGIDLVGVVVNVGPGMFIEDVNVNKVITLQGAGAGVSIVSGAIGGSGSTIQITAAGPVIDGFTITREGNNVADWNNPGLNSAGVAVQGLTVYGTVRNCLITGNRTGIDINNSNGSTVRNNVITFNRTGLIFRNQTDNLMVTENEITDNWTAGILFLDASGGSNVPIQTAANCQFSSNNISGNWYGGMVDRQSGGALPAPGSNLKNFSANWLGTVTPVVTTANTTEPGYAAQIPVAYGGVAANPGGAPDIAGPASANFDYTPYLAVGTDTSPAMGFQGDFQTLYVTAASAQTGAAGRIQEGINLAGTTVKILSGAYTESPTTAATSITLAPGASPGQVVINGNLTLDGNDTLDFELNGPAAGTGYDQFVVNGMVTLGGATLGLSATFTYADCAVLTLIDNDDTDAVSGTFNGLAAGSVVSVGGQNFRIFYNGGTGNDVVLVKDTTPPMITCPGPTSVQCFGLIPAPDTGLVTAMDDCSSVTKSFVGDAYSTNGCIITVTRTYRATDASGNFNDCAQVITVQDTTPPVINCGQTETVSCQQGWGFTVPIVNDNCDGLISGNAVVLSTDTNFGCGYTFVATRVWMVSDQCGNSTLCTQVVNFVDFIPPTITACAPDVTVQCFGDVPAPNVALVTATHQFDACETTAPVVTHVGDTYATNGCVITVTRTYKATDACTNMVTCAQVITVQDTTPPGITCPMSVTVECFGDIPAADLGAVTATDNCGAVTKTFEGDIYATNGCVIIVTRTYKATDACTNMATCTQIITVQDTTAPSMTCPVNLTVQCFGDIPASDLGAVSATDNCGGAVTKSFEGDTYATNGCIITVTRTYKATDACTNMATCTQTITVQDTSPPVLVTPADAVVECDQPINAGTATATDNCDATPTVTSMDMSPVIVTTNTPDGWVPRTTGSGGPNTATAEYVNGPATPPLGAGSARLAVGSNGGGAAEYRHTGYSNTLLSAITELRYSTYRTQDGAGGQMPYVLLNIDLNGDGALDDQIFFEPVYQVPAFNPALPDQGPMQTGAWQRWDARVGGWWSLNGLAGLNPGAGVKSLAIYIAANPTARIINDALGRGGLRLVAGFGAGAWDNFDGNIDAVTVGTNGISTTYDLELAVACPIPSVVRTWKATDDCGNVATSSQLIRVQDTTAPTIICPPSFTVTTTDPMGISVSFSVSTGDNCDLTPTVNCTPASGSNFPPGPTLVSCTASDDCGNTSMPCTFTVTVNRAPVALDNGGATRQNTSMLIARGKLLANDTDADGDPLTVTGVSATSTNGGIVVLGATHVTYTPVPGFTGVDRFSYTISDGRGGTATADVEVLVVSGNLPSLNQVSITVAGGFVTVRFAGIPGNTYVIERSVDLMTWTPATTVVAPLHGIIEYTEPVGMPAAFFRTVSP